MAGERTLEETPTWAVAVVCFVLVAISIVIEFIIHLVGKWLKKRNKKALNEALEKIKAELMLLGFISLLLTVGQGPISDICVAKAIGDTWHPCNKKQEIGKYGDKEEEYSGDNSRRKLLTSVDFSGESHRRFLASNYDKCAAKGQVPFVSYYGIHQLHIFIFVLAVSHVLYCITTLALGRAKMSRWKKWEMETKTTEYQFTHDPERFRFTRDTSFGRRHLNFWTKSPFLLWIACFFRQFVRSVPKVDYLTLRHGFISAHLAPQSQANFDFQKYIQRSLEEDFKVVVAIRLLIQILCSYVTLPLYALVTQMGSSMKSTIFNDDVAKALRSWHQTARKHVKQSHHGHPGSVTPPASAPGTPLHGSSPIHLLRHYRAEIDSAFTSPRPSNFDNNEFCEPDGCPVPVSPSRRHDDALWPHHINRENRDLGAAAPDTEGLELSSTPLGPRDLPAHHEIDIKEAGFSFEKGPR
ncbi:hypothetical protein U1Q18_013164 [Sarracenia purpurea var. burkii]